MRRVPYRSAVSSYMEVAPTRVGPMCVEVGPAGVDMTVGERFHLAVADNYLTMTRYRGPARHRTLRICRKGVFVARGLHSAELALWIRERTGRFRRIVSVHPVALSAPADFESWKQFDRAAGALRNGLRAFGGDVRNAWEFGSRLHRVLLIQKSDRVVVCAGGPFVMGVRRTFEVMRDGTVVHGTQFGEITERGDVRGIAYTFGDRIRFSRYSGGLGPSLHVPWMSAPDRGELARHLRNFVRVVAGA